MANKKAGGTAPGWSMAARGDEQRDQRQRNRGREQSEFRSHYHPAVR